MIGAKTAVFCFSILLAKHLKNMKMQWKLTKRKIEK